MNPSVGAPGALGQNLFAGHSSNSRGQSALDCGGVRLNLPSGEFRAVIGQNDFEIAHGSRLGSFPRCRLSKYFARLQETEAAALSESDDCCVSYTISFHVA